MSDTAVCIPSGVAVPATNRAFVRGPDGRVEALDAGTGIVIERSDVAATPVAAAGDEVVAVRPPSAADAGEVALLVAGGETLGTRWRVPLLDGGTLGAVAAALDHVAVAAQVDGDVVRVAADLQTRYRGGAAPGDEVLDAAHGDRRYVLVLRRDTGEAVDRDVTDIDPATIDLGASAGDVASSTAVAASEPIAAERAYRWTVGGQRAGPPVPDHDPAGAAATVVGDRIVYEVTERDPGGAAVRRFLRGRDVDTDEPAWSHLIDETPVVPQPPLPP